MPSISDTIRRAAALRTAPTALAGHHRALTGFANPGALDAFVYAPPMLQPDAALVVVLHGCTQNAAGYDHGAGWSQLADEGGFALLFPQQRRANNPNLCFNWFVADDVAALGGEAQSILAMIAAAADEHDIDPAKIYVTGMSAGGAMTAALLAAAPQVFAGGAIIAGLAAGVATTIPGAFEAMRGDALPGEAALQHTLRAGSYAGPWPKLSLWQGDADRTVEARNLEAIIGQWRGVHKVTTAPSRSERIGAHRRRVWTDASGHEVIEAITLTGMGHGTPVGGGDGAAGPYMLDVGLSSSRHIARFWGLDVAAAPRLAEAVRPRADVPPRPRARPAIKHGGVGKVINDALRAAGLLR